MARKVPGASTWETIIFNDYLKTSADSHNGIGIGICPGDGTIHLAFDNHNDLLNYRYSVTGLAAGIGSPPWDASSFLPVQHYLKPGVNFTDKFTYPRFLATPEGNLILHYRSFISQINNRIALYEADSGTWTEDRRVVGGSGTYIDTAYGPSTARRMYDNCLTYDDLRHHDHLFHLAGKRCPALTFHV
ncbi:MAG: BNR-4 repeat-containing protein [Flavobacteriales bacterium]|nr:BNR-4 repeat-containing protein [Flavobacteriales bacterium]